MKPIAMGGSVMLLAFALVATPRATLAADDSACARYADPLAYNACLASHGPKANIARPSDGDGPAAPVQARPAGHPAGRGWRPELRRHGRSHMEFNLK